MHHYPFHIGDYRSATAHLNDAEDLAYRRALDFYYDTELPIPLDITPVARRLRVSAGVLEIVLNDFFVKQDDGWHHLRCDAEIERYSHFVEDGKRGAEKRWKKKNAPKHGLTDSPPIAPLSPEDSPPNQGLMPTVNREPITDNQESTALSGKPDVSPPINGSRAKAIELLDFLNLKTGKRFRPVDATLKPIAARLKEFELQELKSMISMKAREWGQDEKMSDYLRPMTLFAASNCANYVGQLHRED